MRREKDNIGKSEVSSFETETCAKSIKHVRTKRTSGLAAMSVIIYFFDWIAEKIYRALINGCFGTIFTAYDREQNAFENGFVKGYFKESKIFGKSFRKIRQKLSEGFETSFFLGKLRDSLHSFLALPLHSYGNFWMSFGIYTTLLYFIKMLVYGTGFSEIGTLLFGIIICLIAIPLLIAKDPLAEAVGKGYFTRLLFADCFGFRDESFIIAESSSHKRSNFMILIGMICGVMTFFIHPAAILIFIFACVGIALVMSAPEIGILIALFSLPFLSLFDTPAILLGGIIGLTMLSYVIKLVQGKRIFRIELLDFAVILFLIILYFGGAVSAGGVMSFQAALLSVMLMMGYFLTVNLMRTAKWLKRCFAALVSSGTIVAALGIVQYLFGVLNRSTLDQNYFRGIKGRVTAFFDNSNMLAFYLVMIFLLAMTFLLRSKKIQERLLLLFSVTVIFLCILFTWSRGAWIALIISALIYFLFYSKKTVRFLILLLCAVPFLPMLLPSNVWSRFSSIGNMADSSTMYRMYTWKGTFQAIKNYFFGGIGYGGEAYENVYPGFAFAGMEGAEHAHSLYLQIWISLGIVGLIVFLAVIFFFMQQCLESIHKSSDPESSMMIYAVFCSVVAALIMGVFDYIWYNYRIFFLFWFLLGLASAYARFERNERKRKQIFESSDAYSAFLDIEIKK